MEMNNYQKQAMKTAIFPPLYLKDGEKEVEVAWAYPAIKLAGEVGELEEKLGKIIRDKKGVICEEDLVLIKKELGDQLWYIAALCDTLGLDMNDVAQTNLDKLAKRYVEGKIGGSGDSR